MSYEVISGLHVKKLEGGAGYLVLVKHDNSNVSPKIPYWTCVGVSGCKSFRQSVPTTQELTEVLESKKVVPYKTEAEAVDYIVGCYANNDWQGGNSKYAKAVNNMISAEWIDGRFLKELAVAAFNAGLSDMEAAFLKRSQNAYNDYYAANKKALYKALHELEKSPKGTFIIRFTDPIYPLYPELEVKYLESISSRCYRTYRYIESAKIYKDFDRAIQDATRVKKNVHEAWGHTKFYAEILNAKTHEVVKKI